MIDEEIYTYLKKKLSPVSVSIEVPRTPPQRFVTVMKTGSRQVGFSFYESTFAVQSWAESRAAAMELSYRACEAMRQAPDELDSVTRSRGSDYDFTDTQTKKYRYQAVFTVSHY